MGTYLVIVATTEDGHQDKAIAGELWRDTVQDVVCLVESDVTFGVKAGAVVCCQCGRGRA
jgi:hypothetical protein